MHSSGEYLYLTAFREEEGYTSLYDLDLYDFATEEYETLADLGSDCYYYFEIDDRFYTTSSVIHYESHRLKCFDKNKLSTPLGNKSFSSVDRMNGKILIQNDLKISCYEEGREVGFFNVESDFAGFVWTSPKQNVAILLYTKYDEDEEEVDWDYPGTYYLVTFDDFYNIIEKKPILQETEIVKYGYFLPGRENELIYTKAVDANGDNVVDYNDKRNVTILSMDLKTLESYVVCDEPMEIRDLQVHPSGRIFFYDETEEDQGGNLWFINRKNNAKHVVMNLKDGCYQNFRLDKDWTKLVYVNVLDTTGDGKRYSWEDDSQIYLVDLKGLMENKF